MVDVQAKAASGEKLTTKETEEVIDFVDAAADAILKAAGDGKLNWLDLPKILPVVSKASPALKDIKQVWPELKDLDSTEAEALMGRFSITVTKWAAAIAALGELETA